jgi:acetylornithine deacetylase/succinyl-diaminopimelate desuccinylase family protein
MNDTTPLLRDLVKLSSVNPMGRDLPSDICLEHRVTAYLERFFRELGAPFERQSVAPGRDNIVAHFVNPAAQRTLLFEVHQDTVPVDHMTIDPFGAAIDGNRLYGRGACDIKGGMAAMMAAFARLVRDKPSGAANLTLACTVDEEYTFLGVQELVKRGIKADMAVVAEPTRLNIVHAHKGVARWHVAAPGRSCHSSSPEQGINAIYRMGRLLVEIEMYAQKLRAGPGDPLLGPPTLSVGRIEGGTSVNTVPDRCRIDVDRRLIRGENPDETRRHFEAFLQAAVDDPFECSPLLLAKDALDSAGADQLIGVLGQAINTVRGSHTVHPVPYGTDAPVIASAGIPAVVFGPGDIAQAHTKDEWVALDEVEQASEILYRLASSPLAG